MYAKKLDKGDILCYNRDADKEKNVHNVNINRRACERKGKPIERWGRKATGPKAQEPGQPGCRLSGVDINSPVPTRTGLFLFWQDTLFRAYPWATVWLRDGSVASMVLRGSDVAYETGVRGAGSAETVVL